jgi:hypothetical protein
MKKLVLLLGILVLTGLAAGCTAKIGGTSIRPTTDESAEIIKKALAVNKTIYYQIVPSQWGKMIWSIVKEPLVNPDEHTVKFGELLSQEVEKFFKEKGFELKRVYKPSDVPSSALYIEMRTSMSTHGRGENLFYACGGGRWFVYLNGNKLNEIYDFQCRSPFIGYPGLNWYVSELAPRMVKGFFNE